MSPLLPVRPGAICLRKRATSQALVWRTVSLTYHVLCISPPGVARQKTLRTANHSTNELCGQDGVVHAMQGAEKAISEPNSWSPTLSGRC